MKLQNFSCAGRFLMKWLGLLLAMLCVATNANAQAAESDLAGAKDHPYIKRFANSSIVLYDTKRFDSVEFQTSTFARFNIVNRQREFVSAPVVV